MEPLLQEFAFQRHPQGANSPQVTKRNSYWSKANHVDGFLEIDLVQFGREDCSVDSDNNFKSFWAEDTVKAVN